MKIDIEGAELRALKGAGRLLARSPNVTLIIEISPRMLSSDGFAVDDLLCHLASVGLFVRRIQEAGQLGAIYADVDTDHTAFEYFDAQDKSLGTFATPIADNGLSFLGVAFPEPVIHRVRITYGTVALGPDDSAQNDVAVMDDFIYGEPQAIH